MALATRCPHCHTTFRVAHDQLKLRAGLVRCGACKEIFNGIEHLLRPDEPAHVPAPASHPEIPPSPVSENAVSTTPEEATPASEAPASSEVSNAEPGTPEEKSAPAAAEEFVDFSEFLSPAKTSSATPSDQSENASSPTAEVDDSDPLLRMTLMDFREIGPGMDEAIEHNTTDGTASGQEAAGTEPAGEEDPDAPDPIAQAIDHLQSKPGRRADDALARDDTDELDIAESEEPSFVKHGRRKQQIGRVIRILMAIASPLLLIALLAQGTYVFRNQIAVWWPQSKPILASACSAIGCRLDLPRQIDAVSIESSELQTLAANSELFVLTTLLRNRSATAQGWPNIELTLNDANEKAIARRVFTPRDYLLPTADLSKGFAPMSEQSVKLFFELTQLKPFGYRVYLFYP